MKLRNKISNKLVFLFAFFVGSVIFFCLLKWWPAFGQMIFTRGLFQVWRLLYDFTLGLLPFPPVLLFVSFALIKGFRNKGRIINWQKARRGGLVNICWAGIAFFWLWGFHYAAGSQLRGVEGTPSDDEIFEWALEVQHQLVLERPEQFYVIPESEVRLRLEAYLQKQGWPILGRVRARALDDGGALRYLGISGIYLPWLMEGHLSASLPIEVQSFVQAHEMAHGYGIAQESEADYCAFNCLHIKLGNEHDAMAKWCATYELWSVLRRVLKDRNTDLYVEFVQLCPHELKVRHDAVKADFQGYTGMVSEFGQQSNDAYLKSMGVKDGIGDYDRWWSWVWTNR